MKLKNKIKPDICTSLNNCAGGDYCKECSHALFRHEIKIDKIYRFEFNQRFGVTFLTENGQASKMQLDEKHPFWTEFQKWYNKKFIEER